MQIILEEFRHKLPGWTLAFADLEEGTMGLCDLERRTIWLDVGLDSRERRSTLIHEMLHALRGDASDDPEAEALVRRETARRMLPAVALFAVLQHTPHPEDVAESLDVDLAVLADGMRALTREELCHVRRLLLPAIPREHGDHRCAIGRYWHHYRLPGASPCATVCPCSPQTVGALAAAS